MLDNYKLETYRKYRERYKEEYQDYWFDEIAAQRVIRFFENELHHQLGELAGQRVKLQHWQKRILRHFFGWKSIKTGLRKYKTLYLEVPRKNGKSILAAGLALYLLDADKEPAARVACFAANEDQIRDAVFEVAKGMVEINPKLSNRMKCFKKTITAYASAGNFQILSGSKKGKHGKNLSALIGDEVHEWDNREVMDALRTSMVTRAQPVEIYLTTAGYDRNSICFELHEYARNVNLGVIKDPTFLGVIYGADENDDWTDPKVWKKANPNLGVSVRLDFLRRECLKAQEVLAYENTFKRLHLNIWTEQDSRWLSLKTWDACKMEFTIDDFKGRSCILGVDLSISVDLGALSILIPPTEKPADFNFDKWSVIPVFFLPKDAIAIRKKRDRIPYDDWARMGLIKTCEGGILDYLMIEHEIEEIGKILQVEEIVIDPWNAVQFAQHLKDKGLNVQFWRQGLISMNAPTKMLSELIASQKLAHNGNQVLRWNASNVAIEQDAAGNIKPSKKKSKEKIDGIVATINALGRAVIAEKTTSIYEERDVIVL